MKKLYFFTSMLLSAIIVVAQEVVIIPDDDNNKSDLSKLFVPGDYDFSGLPEEGGGDLWYANGWGNAVMAADFNNDGNKDVFLMGCVSYGDVQNATPQNVLFLGNGKGQFTSHLLPSEGAYYFGYAGYIKIAEDKTIIGATGCDKEANWWDPMYNFGMKHRYTTSLHELSFDAEGLPVWTLVKKLEDGSCGAGASVNLYDFNNDGNYDVLISGTIGLPESESELISEYGAATQILYLGDDNGNFTRKTHVETGLWPVQDGGAIVADFNNDGFLDVVSVMSKSGYSWNDGGNNEKKSYGSGVYVSLNKGDGTFETKSVVKSEKEGNNYFVSEGARVQVLDINNDGSIDIWYGLNDQVSSDPWRYRGGFLLNDGDGNFTMHNKRFDNTDYTPLGVERCTPLIGDFNQDGNMDMWYNTWLPTTDLDNPEKANNCQCLVGVLHLGNGEGGFTQTVFRGEGEQNTEADQRFCSLKSCSYAAADFNNDGVLDVVAISGDSHDNNYKGITYMKGAVQASANAAPLPQDNMLRPVQSSVIPVVESQLDVLYTNGQLIVRDCKDVQVNIISITGMKMDFFVADKDVYNHVLNLANGLYIVSVGNNSKKILVNN